MLKKLRLLDVLKNHSPRKEIIEDTSSYLNVFFYPKKEEIRVYYLDTKNILAKIYYSEVDEDSFDIIEKMADEDNVNIIGFTGIMMAGTECTKVINDNLIESPYYKDIINPDAFGSNNLYKIKIKDYDNKTQLKFYILSSSKKHALEDFEKLKSECNLDGDSIMYTGTVCSIKRIKNFN